ncbi:MAG: S24 family peptidase, partial [Balneola sp.]
MSLNPDEANLRLKEVIKSIKATYDDIEEETGISRNTWIRLTKPGNSIKVEHIYLLGDKYDIDVNYVLTGERSVPTWAHSESVPTSAKNKSVQTSEHQQSFPTWGKVNEDNINYDPTEFVSVPYYPNVYASGGQGLIAENESNLQILFRRYFFSKTIQASPEGCFVVKLKGDSMQPMFKDGSDLLVDSARTKIKEGPAFMVRIDDDHYCKLLAKLP